MKLRAEIDAAFEDVDRAMQDIATNTMAILVMRTPVDTGYTRTQWVVEWDGPRAFAVANRVDWIERLEAGWSAQAPNGIIGASVPVIRSAIEAIVR